MLRSNPMKKRTSLQLLYCYIGALSLAGLWGQGVYIGSQSSQPHQSAGLELNFQDKGFLPPRLTLVQRNSIQNPAPGLQIYNTDSECLEIFHTPNWQPISCKCVSLPNAGFSFGTATENNPVTFQPNQLNLAYQWSFPGGTPSVSSAQSPQVTYSATGNYTVTLIVSDANGCTDSSSQTVTVVNPGVTYSQFFSGNVSASGAQCSAWTQFRSSLQPGIYSTMTFSGSLGGTQSCTNAASVNQIATALQNGTVTSIVCGANTWRIGTSCGGSNPSTVELTNTAATCQCDPGFTLRPCINNDNWGAAGSSTCGASPQTLTLTFQ